MGHNENAELVRRLEDAWSRNDLELVRQLHAPDFVSHTSPPGIEPTMDNFLMAHRMSIRAFPDRQVHIEDLVAHGDRVVVRCRVTGTNTGGVPWMGLPPNGARVDYEWISIYRIADGKIAEHWAVNDNLKLMEQLKAASSLDLAASSRAEVIRPTDASYDEARRAIFNAMVDRRPALIVRPYSAADVIDAVNLGRERGLPVAIRGGGHSVAGNAVCDDGIMIDLRYLRGVHVDQGAATARAGGGCVWGEFDRETQLFGLATPGGRVTSTGVGGFTVGGGYGWLSPKYGLTCDNLIEADVVTADGRLVRASEDENPDLLWGLRGGGSNFGVVTSFLFRLHPVGPILMGGLLLYRIEEAKEVARAYRDHVDGGPDDLASAMSIFAAPPLPFVPPEQHGKPVLGVVALYIGDPKESEPFVGPMKRTGTPLVDLIQPMPYTVFQAVLDPVSPWGLLNYHRGLHLEALSDGAIDTWVDLASEISTTSPVTQTTIYRHGGQVSRIPPDASAAGHRDAAYMAHPIAIWSDPRDTDRHLAWIRQFSDAMAPFTTGGLYLNFETDTGADRVRAGFDEERYRRLVALKDAWDPDNVFRVNQNVRPSAATGSPSG